MNSTSRNRHASNWVRLEARLRNRIISSLTSSEWKDDPPVCARARAPRTGPVNPPNKKRCRWQSQAEPRRFRRSSLVDAQTPECWRSLWQYPSIGRLQAIGVRINLQAKPIHMFPRSGEQVGNSMRRSPKSQNDDGEFYAVSPQIGHRCRLTGSSLAFQEGDVHTAQDKTGGSCQPQNAIGPRDSLPMLDDGEERKKQRRRAQHEPPETHKATAYAHHVRRRKIVVGLRHGHLPGYCEVYRVAARPPEETSSGYLPLNP